MAAETIESFPLISTASLGHPMCRLIVALKSNACVTRRSRKRYSAFCAIVGICLAILLNKGVLLADLSSAASHSKRAGDQTLRLTIEPMKLVYKIPESVDIQMIVKNVSSLTISIPTFQSSWDQYKQNFLGAFVLEFTIYRVQDGRRTAIPLGRPAVSYLDFPDPESSSLKPAAVWKTVVDLKRWWAPKEPGIYEVTGIWNIEPLAKMSGDKQFSKVNHKVAAEPITIELVK
jgi:hypothetical protein